MNKLRSNTELKYEIQRTIGELDRNVCDRVITNFNDRIKVCRHTGAENMLDIIFKH